MSFFSEPQFHLHSASVSHNVKHSVFCRMLNTFCILNNVFLLVNTCIFSVPIWNFAKYFCLYAVTNLAVEKKKKKKKMEHDESLVLSLLSMLWHNSPHSICHAPERGDQCHADIQGNRLSWKLPVRQVKGHSWWPLIAPSRGHGSFPQRSFWPMLRRSLWRWKRVSKFLKPFLAQE